MNEIYGSVAGFKAYFSARGVDVSTYDDASIGYKLLVASEWIDAVYGQSFPGLKVGQRDQTREWPRTGAFDQDGYVIPFNEIPMEVENATYEAALQELKSAGVLNIDYVPNKYKRVSVDGAISVEFTNVTQASDIQRQFVAIDRIINSVLTGANGVVASFSGSVERI